ncbi:hypothetical protein GQ457_02G035630 [Hibiscus cannabinus]
MDAIAIATGAAANASSEAAKGILQEATRHIRYVIIYKKTVEKFEEKRKTLIAKRTSVEQDVDGAKRNGEKIKSHVLEWCNRVDKAIIEEEKEVKALEVKAMSKCFSGLCPNIKSRYRLSRKAEEAVTTFDALINECHFPQVGFRDVPKTIVNEDFETFKSREKVFNDIMESLKVSTRRMIGVHGMAGVGKSWLVKEVERQAQEAKSFNSVVLVTVSRSPEVFKIQAQIAESLGLNLKEISLVPRARCPDSIWKSTQRMQILMTSRDEHVLCNVMGATKIFRLDDLDEEEAWELFKKMAGDCVESADVRPIAIEVAKKCAGLPLAIATVASALRNKREFAWRDALRKLQKPYSGNSSEISAKVYSAIELSINLLPSEDLKQTFLLCSLLRHDARIEDLLRYAIGLGFIKGVDTLKEARDSLLNMTSTLKESCLLRGSNTDDQFFEVHDLTYIVAKSMASKDNQVFALNQEEVLTDWQDHCKLGDDITIIGGLKNLEILSLLESDIKILPKEIGQLVKLKLLDVSGCAKLKMISVGVLSSLTRLEEIYVGGTCIQWGQSSTASLAELNTLSRLSTLEVQIPDAKDAPQDFFQGLQKLERYKIFIGEEWECFDNYQYSRTINLRLIIRIDDLDRGIKKLLKKTEDLHLDELKGVKIALQELTDEERLSGLKNLHIQNGLDIEYIINGENEFPQLQSMTLQSLPQLLSFCPQHQTNGTNSLPQHELPLFSEMISFPCLENLWLKSINVTRLWHNQLSTTSYGKLTTLKIEGCGSLKHLFSFSMAKSLLHLTDFEIIGCHCLREIIFMEEIEEEAQATMNLALFPQLKSLELKDLQHLIEFCSYSRNQVIEFSAFKSLMIDNCLELEGFICRSSMQDNQCISSQVLFDNEVAFPSLEELSISNLRKLKMIWEDPLPPNSFSKLRVISIKGLSNLEYVWKNDPKGIFSFKNLRQIYVENCWSLKKVFPASLARNLPQLGVLSIVACGVEEIVSKVEDGSDSETTVTFKFDQLSSLMLWWLPECKWFYPGRHTTKWPMLKELLAYVCGEMKIFGTQLDSPPPLFLVEKVIPKLQRLSLDCDYAAMISGGRFSSSLFHEIKEFMVRGNKSVSEFQFSFLERLYNLEELCIAYCEIKELFCTEGDTDDNKVAYARTLSTVRKLQLIGLPNLKDYLWKQDLQVDHILPNLETLEVQNCEDLMSLGSSSASFQNLTTLEVWGCREMKYLDTCLAVQGLSQLKKLIIRECISVKEIVASVEDEATCSIIFSRLKSMELVNLPRLKSFCSGNHTFGFPCLEEVIVSGCLELERFCKGVLNAPLLQSVEYGEGKGHWSGDLDSTVQHLHSTEVWYQGIKCFVLSEFSKSIEIWKEKSLDFKNLTILEVEECNSLKYIFSVSMALGLVQLKHMTVKNCPMMEYIIEKGAEETATDTVWLPELESITLESCSDLRSFCMGSITLQCLLEKMGVVIIQTLENTVLCSDLELLELSSTNIQKLWPDKPNRDVSSNVQNLQFLTVEGCHNLEYLFPSFLIKYFVRLSNLVVFKCESMEQVILTEEEGINEIYLFTELRLLYLVDLPKLGTFCHGDNSETDDPSLFNQKVRFPSLNDLIIEDMGNCRKIWHDKVTMASFYELTNLRVENCERLSNILPFSMVERLQKLETLKICECESLEQIIGREDDHRLNSNESLTGTSTQSTELKSTNIKFVFPKIRELKLRTLPKLKGFYNKVHTTEWPSLKRLKVRDCSKVETFTREYINFGETQGDSLPLISVQQPLFWVTEETFPNLEELFLIQNGNMKELWHGALAHLKGLTLIELPMLTHLWKKEVSFAGPSVSFKHLTTLKVSKCHGFRDLLTFTIAKSMVQLETMSVTDCQMIEEIIASTTDEVTDAIVFNQLESLELDSLPCLSSFCSGNYSMVFPALEEVIMGQCPKMEFFTMGELRTPMLHALQSTNGEEGEEVELWEGDLNATIQQMFIEKVCTNRKLFMLKSCSSRIHTNERPSLKIVEENGQTLDGSTRSDGGSEMLSKSGGDRFWKPDQGGNSVSYADIVGGSAKGDDKDKDGLKKLPCDPNKVEVLDEDCIIDKSGKFPTIKFSERVHKLIDSNMRNVIIVRLLGRNIGYQTLLNRIQALWKPAGEVQLIDLENNYFLVRVEDPRDYKKILTDGPWTIYGNYLTVQPWSRSFTTLEKHPSRVVVWVRLPGLPYRYYSKALFRRIAAIVGDVVRVDYNTKAGERGKFARLAVTVDLNKPLVPCIGIDGFIQNLEYEGLHHICYSCGVYGHLQESCGGKDGRNGGSKENPIAPEREKETNEEVTKERELFGPWMMVDNRRKRMQARSIPSGKITGPMGTESVNRFAMLEDEQTANLEEQGLELGAGMNAERVEQVHLSGNIRSSDGVRVSTTAVRNGVTHRGSTSTGNAKGNSRKAEMAVVLPIVEGQQVSVVEHSVLGGNSEHTAVSLFEKGHGNVRSKGMVHGKLHGIRRGVREGVQQGLKIRKPQDTRTISRPVLSEWVDTMQLQIKALSTQANNDPRGPARAVVNQDGELEPTVTTLTRLGTEQRLRPRNRLW